MRKGNSIALPELAAELVRLKVDVIVTGGPNVNPRCQESNYDDSHRHDAAIVDPVGTGSSPALRDLAETSLDCPPLPRS